MRKLEMAIDLIKEKSDADGRCTMSKRKLGELLCIRYPASFKDAEDGRVYVVYKLGNHCERYEKLILQRVPELVDLELFNFSNVISAKELGVEVVQNKRLIRAGKLNIAHGHEFARGFVAPVNPARGFYLKAKSNILGGHHHTVSAHQEQDVNGNIIGAWSTGCLCELHPKYMPINRWQHGMATVENFGTDFSVKNLTIIKGKVM